jgi:hypothetical protein
MLPKTAQGVRHEPLVVMQLSESIGVDGARVARKVHGRK